jgi:hypothetical protein
MLYDSPLVKQYVNDKDTDESSQEGLAGERTFVPYPEMGAEPARDWPPDPSSSCSGRAGAHGRMPKRRGQRCQNKAKPGKTNQNAPEQSRANQRFAFLENKNVCGVVRESTERKDSPGGRKLNLEEKKIKLRTRKIKPEPEKIKPVRTFVSRAPERVF